MGMSTWPIGKPSTNRRYLLSETSDFSLYGELGYMTDIDFLEKKGREISWRMSDKKTIIAEYDNKFAVFEI